MYAHADTGVGKDKPCDGIRYDVFHNQHDLSRHQLDMNVFRPTVEHKDISQTKTQEQDYSKDSNIEKKSGGAHPCKGRMYGFYHDPHQTKQQEAQSNEAKKEHIKYSTIDSKVTHAGYGAMHDTRAYSSDDAGLAAAAQAAQASHYSARQHDMNSVDTVVNFNFDSRRYSRIESDMRTMQYSMQQNPSMVIRNYTGQESNEKYKRYEKKYEAATKKYSGREIKEVESSIREAKKETEKKSVKEAGPRKKILRKKERPTLKTKETRKTDRKSKRQKQIKTKKADKNDIHRRALPSGPEAVRKGHSPSDRKGK